jgi:uncharacterized membrane protein YqhA
MAMQKIGRPTPPTDDGIDRREPAVPLAPFARAIGRTRYVVLAAVAAVLLVAMALFILGAALAVLRVWDAGLGLLHGELGGSTDLTVEFLEVVSVMLKAVVFYIIGIGLYSLFIAPLNLTTALGVETLNDLETKVVSVVVVIMAVTFLGHFIRWEQPTNTLLFGATLAVVVAALVLFQAYTHRAKEDQRRHNPDTQMRAKRELFDEDREARAIRPDEVSGGDPAAG